MKKAILLMLPILLLAACGETPTPEPPEPTPPEPIPGEIRYEYTPMLRKETSTKTSKYLCSFFYKAEYFEEDAKVFNKDLALLSCGKSLMSESEKTIKDFYSQAEFDNVETHYVAVKTEDTVSYAFAHIKIEEFDLVSLVVCGHNYGLEWKNNFLVGESGDHLGFSMRANDIYSSLKTYLANYENYKLWISGYSRGAAIANVLSHYILSRDEIEIEQEDMFVYTFEAPKGLAAENAIPYENVFNVLYSGDLITYFAPAELGLARCGIDYDLYTSSQDLNDKLTAFDKDIDMPKFVPYNDLTDSSRKVATEQEGIQSLITYLSREGTDSDSELYFHTRQDYVDKVQHTLQTVFSIIFSVPAEVLTLMIEGAMENILTLLGSPEAICNFIMPFLDLAGYAYDPDVLLADCIVVYKLAMTNVLAILPIVSGGNMSDALKRATRVHFPEVDYILLKNLCSSSN